MNEQAKALKAFLDAIAANPLDESTRRVLADWYDDHDEPELADEQRRFDKKVYEAEQRLRRFCDRYGAEYDSFIDGCISGEGYCFSDDFYGEMDSDNWEDIQTVTGAVLNEEHRNNTSFRCAC